MGRTIADRDQRERIRKLAIPPAWSDVWIAPYENAHIQATGVDAAGRRQYIYHEQWRAQKDRAKFDRMLELAGSLPAARRKVTMELRVPEPTKRRALATAFRMLDTGSLRIGSERYAELNGSIGLSTLQVEHAAVDGKRVHLSFPAKSGQVWESEIRDADLARVVQELSQREPDERLLAWQDDRGWHPLDPTDINDYVRARLGGAFSAKDFRTLHGTIAAAISLAKHGPEQTKTGRKRAVAQAMRKAAEALGNTPAIARSSYVDPRVVDCYQQGHTIDPNRLVSAEAELRELLL